MKEDSTKFETMLGKFGDSIGILAQSFEKLASTQKTQTAILALLGTGALGLVWKFLEIKLLTP
jgi:hypothetical protein